MITALIMAGGRGERFWPKSRFSLPKQLLPIGGRRTMVQETVDRIKGFTPERNIFIATRRGLGQEVGRQLPRIPRRNIILEPMGRDTAACIGLAATHINKIYPGATMVVLPADHIIGDRKRFLKTLSAASTIAGATENLVTIGIRPTGPETGYGYIKAGKRVKVQGIRGRGEAYRVGRFTEKPNLKKAKEFVSSGRYFWNSGMFAWKCETILEAIKENMPKLYSGLEAIRKALGTNREKVMTMRVFKKLERISIDYGIMEKARDVLMVKGDFPWDDVGSWLAMERIHPKDGKGNVSLGEFREIDTEDSILISEKELIATIGVKDLIVVTTGDATLICHKSRAQDVKKMVQKLSGEVKMRRYL